MISTHTTPSVRKLLAAAVLVVLGACKASDLEIPNPNVATVIGASADPTAFQLLATGLLSDLRSTRAGWISYTGRLGRESYIFTPQEGRNTLYWPPQGAGAKPVGSSFCTPLTTMPIR